MQDPGQDKLRGDLLRTGVPCPDHQCGAVGCPESFPGAESGPLACGPRTAGKPISGHSDTKSVCKSRRQPPGRPACRPCPSPRTALRPPASSRRIRRRTIPGPRRFPDGTAPGEDSPQRCGFQSGREHPPCPCACRTRALARARRFCCASAAGFGTGALLNRALNRCGLLLRVMLLTREGRNAWTISMVRACWHPAHHLPGSRV
jgi:hypothetical protein